MANETITRMRRIKEISMRSPVHAGIADNIMSLELQLIQLLSAMHYERYTEALAVSNALQARIADTVNKCERLHDLTKKGR